MSDTVAYHTCREAGEERVSILALDLSLTRTGWAVRNGDEVHCGSIPTDKRDSVTARVNDVKVTLTHVVEKYHINTAVLERSFVAGSGDVTRVLCELAGVVKNMLYRHAVTIHEPSPSTWRALTLGSGKADKTAAMEWCRVRGLSPANDDEADACCIALAYGPHMVEILTRGETEKERKKIAEKAKRDAEIAERKRKAEEQRAEREAKRKAEKAAKQAAQAEKKRLAAEAREAKKRRVA